MKRPDVDDADEKTSSRRRRVLAGVIVGDYMHNFADGVFIGTAFHTCGSSMEWTVTAATVFHEIAQEVSDYVLLTDPLQGGLKPVKALFLNFLCGTSVIFGVVVVLGIDELTNTATGLILAYGGGVYIHVGAAECMAKCYTRANGLKLRFLVLLAFAVGATAIGLVLLDHSHCSAEGGGDDGHGH
jgi:zinc transporter ZupT